jgi:hypothetical protein
MSRTEREELCPKRPYEEPTLEKREELAQVTEGLAAPAVPAVPVLISE